MNNPQLQQNQPKKHQTYRNDSILESLRGIGGNVRKTAVKDVGGKIATDALTSLLGRSVRPQQEFRPNNPFQFSREQSPWAAFRKPEIRSREPYITPVETHLKEQIDAVRAELKALSESLKTLDTQVQKTINEVPAKPGIYHKTFFERIRSMLKLLREQVDDSSTWLMFYNNRKEKRGFWKMYKKHGTSFGLSHERSLARSAG
jgi:hypothetical protein